MKHRHGVAARLFAATCALLMAVGMLIPTAQKARADESRYHISLEMSAANWIETSGDYGVVMSWSDSYYDDDPKHDFTVAEYKNSLGKSSSSLSQEWLALLNLDDAVGEHPANGVKDYQFFSQDVTLNGAKKRVQMSAKAYDSYYKVNAASASSDMGTATVTSNPDARDGSYKPATSIGIKANSKPGYKFKQWKLSLTNFESDEVKIADATSAETTLKLGDDASPVLSVDKPKTVTVTAEFEAMTYQIATATDPADGSGGTVSVKVGGAAATSAETGQTVSVDASPATGYTLSSITYKYGESTKPVDITEAKSFAMPAGDTTVTASFEAETTPIPSPATHTITFDANGGKGTMEPQKVTEGVATKLASNYFTRAGYDFTGWNTKADGSGDSYDDSQSVTLDADLDLYAQWESEPTPAQEPDPTPTTDPTPTQDPDPTPTQDPDPTPTTDPTPTQDPDPTPTTDPDPTPTTYAIKVKQPKNGTVVASAKKAAAGKSITLTATPAKACLFKAWTVTDADGNTIKVKSALKAQAEGGAKVVKGTFIMPESAVTASAVFEVEPTPTPATHTVTFDANGGEGVMDPQKVTEGTATELASNEFTRAGYGFVGWNTKANGSGDSYDDTESVTLAADLALYAQWEAAPVATHTITFDKNSDEATGSMDPQVVTDEVETTLNSNAFTRAGFTFVSWNAAADGSGTSYANGAKVTATGDLTLYAQWSRNTHEVPAPTMGTSVGGSIVSRYTEVTYTITQRIPADTAQVGISFDLCETMYYTTNPENVVVRTADGVEVAAARIIDGQHLEVGIDDAGWLANQDVQISFSAKLRDNANLAQYLNDARNTASIPYQAHTQFLYSDGNTATAESAIERHKFSIPVGTKSPTTVVVRGATTPTTSKSSSSGTSGSSSSSLAKTADPTSAAGAVAAAFTGMAAIAAGRTRRRR